MKTTSQDSKQNQSNKVDKTDNVAEKAQQSESVEPAIQSTQQPDSQSSMPTHTVVMGDTLWNVAFKLRPEGMPMEQAMDILYENNPQAFVEGDSAKLVEGSVISFVSGEQDIDQKKRKDKQENDDQDAEAKQQSESDQQQVAEEDQLAATGGEVGAENSEVSDIAEALSERNSEGSDGGLTVVTIALGAAGLFGAASYYKKSNSNEAPTFTSGSSAGNLTENSGANQVVYTAVATDDIDTEVTYSLSGADASSFTINSASGQVRLNLNPDHEVKSQYSFAVVATDSAGLKSSQAVSLQITDIDDAAPSITSASSASIDENIAADSVIYTVTADDSADISDGVTFSLSGTDATALNIDANTGTVTIKSVPNHEAKDSYSFNVIATDAAGNASAPKAVTIAVNNLDEVAPTITSGATANAVDENIDAGQIVYTASATDAEDVSNGVTFSLSGIDAAAFSINESTGEVALIVSPDHEVKSSYSFDVTATDAAGNASAAKTVTLAVNDLDDAAPTITSLATAASVVENSSIVDEIYTASADDSNDISDGFTFSLAGPDAGLLEINAESGKVTLETAADHEAKSQYSFSVIATDAAGNESDPKAVTIDVTDIDDAAPLITSDNTTAVNENVAGQAIYDITYDDSGDDLQSAVAYGFLDNNGDAVGSLITDDLDLSINPDGQITLNNALDFEDKDTHSFIILVTNDQDFATKSDLDYRLGSVKQITLTVNNVDDTAPEVISSATATAIDENGDDGQLVYTAIADDANDVSDGVKFSLAGTDAGAFSINEDTGAVTINSAANFEVKSQYSFDVIATDLSGNASAAKTVTLDINDIDEAAPIITSDATATAVAENSGAGQLVYTATATDDSSVVYSLSGTDAGAFSIDATTGAVTLVANPDFEAQDSYAFNVIATDVYGNASAPKAVSLNITNSDDTAPTISLDITEASVDENSGAGQVIFTATADDSLDVSDGVLYSLSGADADLFNVNGAGQITLTGNPDYEAKSQYSLNVTAVDNAGNNSEPQALTLNIVDLDEVAPIITTPATAKVLQGAGAGALVYRAAVDDSADVSGGVTYSLSGADAGSFTIDPNTGAVNFNPTLDPGTVPVTTVYNFTVQATDAAGNIGTQEVTLSITDQDLDAPEITSNDTATAIDENSGADQVIYRVTSTDESVVTYALTDDAEGAFSIDANTGAVTLNDNPDAEAKSEYSFTVVATDASDNSSTPKTVSLSINNLDEVAPTITSGDIAVAIDENIAAGQVVYIATATDSDAVNAEENDITFSLSGADASAFGIDASSGAVTLLDSPDHEIKSAYSFDIVATDAAGNASDVKSVSLSVNDLDDSAPTITSGDTAAAIDSESDANQVVYTAIADDTADVSDGVIYSLAGADASAFSIDATTGEVSLTDSPNYEVKSAYSFEVIATDAAGNASDSQAVSLKIDELAPPQAEVEFLGANDSGIVGDNISSARVITVSNLKDSATWEYSIDNGVNWSAPLASTVTEITLPDEADSTYQVLVRQTNASNDSADNQPLTSVSEMVEFTVDTSPAFVEVISADSGLSTITISYNEDLDPSVVPDKADYAITQSGNDLTVSEVKFDAQNPSNLLLVIDSGLNNGAVRVVYTPSDNLIQDAAGNQSTTGFNSMIVSDGYIRGADVYIDRNEDGIADANEFLPDYTTDEFGQLILPDSVSNAPENIGKQIIIQGGVNMDTGAFNEIELRAPVGYEVINPLSTLVSKVIETGVSLEDAEAKLAQVFDIKLGDTEELATYDPLSDISENALANRVVVTQIATVLSVASAVNDLTDDTNDVEEIVLNNFVNIVVDAEDTDAAVEIDADRVAEILSTKDEDNNSQLVEGLSTQVLDRVQTAVEDMSKVLVDAEEAQDDGQEIKLPDEVEKVIKAQAIIIDDISPKTPEISLTTQTDLGVSDQDGLTSDSSPMVLVSFDTLANDGLAVVVGDILQIFNNGKTEAPYTLTQSNIDDGFVERSLSNLETGSFFVSASITDRAGNSSFVTSLKITVDIDAPVFDSGAVAAAIDENTAADQVIYTPTSSSDDVWKFELVERNDSAIYFDQETGSVKLGISPNFEGDKNQYTFTLKATDNAGNSSEQQVILNINDLDEVAPTITSDTSAEVVENIGAGQVVYTVTADDTSDISDGVTYSLAGTDAAAFSIDANSGAVTLTANPDFETKSVYSFDVIATDTANNASDPTTVVLNILNADEQAPTITSGDTAVSIDENSGAGQVIYTATASDDADISAGVTFSLAGTDAGLFSIDANSGAVTLVASPDYETKSSYSFDVVGTDAAGNVSAPQTVGLSINNIDDTAPTITSAATATSIDENSGSGQVIYTASADDSADTSGGVTFSLAGADAELFSIDASSGAVTLTANPDYEAKSSYSFEVIAKDAADNVSAPQAVSLAINNIDDTAPTITSSATAVSIDENSGAGQVIYTATADDSADISGGVTFSLAGADAELFSIDTSSGAVTLTANPDYETQSSYSFDVIATDVASNQSAPKAVTLSIGNIDDTAPTITSAATAASIEENSGAGQVIYTAAADDSADISDGVTFSLAGTDAELFSIDENSGAVTLIGNPDYEAQNQYSFDVIATDAANLVSQPQTVTLTIDNVIDSKPIWKSSTQASAIDENSGSDQVVYTANAEVDLEGDSQSTDGITIAYSLSDDSSGVFEIDSESGEVKLKQNPDYETVSNYSFSVIATDSLGNISAPIVVTLDVDNLDDSAPSITSGGNAGSIVEDSGAGQVVYTATADDDSSDVQAVGALNYSLAGTDASAFTINELTGQVSLTADPDFEGQNQYSFDVIATDAAGNESSAKTVTLNVTDLDDTAPVITSSDSAATVVENSGANQMVYTAAATDNNEGDLTYNIVGNTGFVSEGDAPDVQPDTQHIYVSNTELSADGSQVSVTFSYAADEANLSGVGFTTHFDSSVFSLSEVSSVFTGSIASGEQSADSEDSDSDSSTDQVLSFGWASLFGQFPGSTTADLATVTFDIVDTNASISTINFESTSSAAGYEFDAPSYEVAISEPDLLSIDSQTGEVTLLADPDYETNPQYSFDVTATDSSGNVSAPKTVTLNIENIDDTAPVFESSATPRVAPGIGTNKVVYTAQANDGDDPGALVYDIEVDEVIYYSEGVLEQKFIVEDDGSITMQLFLDETIAASQSNLLDNFDITIAFDQQEVGGLTNANVTYNLDPLYGLGNSVEGELLLGVVYFPTPGDLTSDEALVELSYTHEPGVISSKFDIYDVFVNAEDYSGSVSSARLTLDTGLTIDSSTGEVTLASSPDATAQPEYSFTVTATDPMGNVASQKVILTVETDAQAPTFDSSTVDLVSIDHDTGSGQVIHTASANDESGIVYSLSGADAAAFSIDASSGEVRLNDDADYLAQSSYSFDVIATDLAGNASSPQSVTLAVNEPGPMITSPDMNIVLESGGSDQVVYTATSNIVGATYSLVDHTDYSVASDNSIDDSDDQPQVPAETVITVPEVQADTQHVYVSAAEMSEGGDQVTVTFSYKADSPSLSGVGMTVNFDSSVLTVSDISNVFTGAIASGAQSADSGDTDSDSNTDQLLSFGWASLFGQFPGSTAVDLATVTFDIGDGATGSTGLNLVRTSSQAGYTFDGQSQDLVVSANSGSDNDAGSGESQAPTESVVVVPEVQANTQHVYVSESTKSEDGSQVTVTFSYKADSPSLSGVGMTVNFDSSVLTVSEVSNVFTGAIASGAQSADSGDTDTDSATDQALSFGWASLFGQFPGSTEVDLATVTFDIADGATGSTGLNLVRTSSQAGYTFDGQSHDVVISAEAPEDNSGSVDDSSDSEATGSQLSIDSATGAVTLAGEADYQSLSNYIFTVTADNGTDSASQDVGLLVADYLVSSEQSTYQGTADADVFALAGGTAEITSGDGADIFILAPDQDESEELGMHTIKDFESGVDSFDGSAALMAAGYTGLSIALDGGVQADKLNLMFDATADVLDLVDTNNGSLDNVFGSYFDAASNELTFFADTDSAVGQYEVEAFKVKVEGDAPEEDDFKPTLDAFIA